MKVTKTECSVLWNIAMDAAIKSINDEISNEDFQKMIDKFSAKLAQTVNRHVERSLKRDR